MTSSPGKHLASCLCAVAGSRAWLRALADHLRDDHGKSFAGWRGKCATH